MLTILPDEKLKTKYALSIATANIIFIIAGIIIAALISLDPKIQFSESFSIILIIVTSVTFILWAILFPISVIWMKNLKYFIHEERITIHKGIITKIEQNIPFKAVTDFMLHRSIFDRYLNIGTIRVQTAGQSTTTTGYEGHLSGLNEFVEILSELRNKISDTKAIKPIDNSKISAEDFSDNDLLIRILLELKAIREVMEKRESD